MEKAMVMKKIPANKTRGGIRIIKRFKKEWLLHLMIVPAFVITLIFSYGPIYGLIMAFQDFSPALGFQNSPFIGLDNFEWIFSQPAFVRAIYNTLFISLFKIALGIAASVLFALLLNEIGNIYMKRLFQTIVYIPHFISWIILAGIMQIVLASDGMLNSVIMAMGGNDVPFLASPSIFAWTMIWSDVWKSFGFGTVVYLAAITSINPELYESAVIDGAGRLKQTYYITLPMLGPIIVLMLTLALGSVLNAGFDQIFNLYHPVVYSTGDIIDTYIFRLGLQDGRFSIAAAVGLFRSVVSLVMISVSLYTAYKFANYRIF